jgi:hypothetical protein
MRGSAEQGDSAIYRVRGGYAPTQLICDDSVDMAANIF